jgi:nitrite reductase (NO-forming)
MRLPTPTRLSDLLLRLGRDAARVDRRRFLLGASALGAGLAACRPDADRRAAAGDGARGPGRPSPGEPTFNSSSRADTAVLEGRHTTSATPAVGGAPAPFRRRDPELPPVSSERTLRLHWRARELPVRVRPDLTVAAWTFEGDLPGPVVHVRQGDTVEFTLTNEGSVPHSMDFHAAQIDPRRAFRSVARGRSVSFTFRPPHAGAFMYHCGTAPVLLHIGSGMYGAIVVDPPQPLPPAREFVLVQSEFYLRQAPGGAAVFDYRRMMETVPDYVVFNGRPDQYVTEPLRVRRGELVRFHVVSAGPTHPCSFHVVGEQFDAVYLGAPPEMPLRGVQTFTVPPGGGMVFEMLADVAGEFPFVNHGFGHGQKGAIGFLVVEE